MIVGPVEFTLTVITDLGRADRGRAELDVRGMDGAHIDGALVHVEPKEFVRAAGPGRCRINLSRPLIVHGPSYLAVWVENRSGETIAAAAIVIFMDEQQRIRATLQPRPLTPS